MKKVRQGVFETNSSSTHSITICSPEDLKLLKTGNHPDESLQEDWNDMEESDLETYVQNYTTPKGEEIVIFGKYGYHG